MGLTSVLSIMCLENIKVNYFYFFSFTTRYLHKFPLEENDYFLLQIFVLKFEFLQYKNNLAT